MRLLCFGWLLALCVFSLQMPQFSAFTNGTLLPYYICGPPTDGLPKSLGTWLPYSKRSTAAVGTTATTPRLDYPLDVGNGGSILNTKLVVTNWHNRNSTTACKQVIFVTSALTANAAVVNQIVPGQTHTLTLTINAHPDANGIPQCDTYTSAAQVTADDIANIALDGAVVYAINATGARVGTFTAFGDANLNPVTMQSWVACGPVGTGIAHNQLISCVGQYFGIQWVAPGNLAVGSTVTFKGAAVSDGGYGAHASTLNIILPAAAGIAVTKPTITAIKEIGDVLAVFFNDNAKNAPAGNTPILATKFSVAITVNGAAIPKFNVTQSPALVKIDQTIKGKTVVATVTGFNPTALPSTSAPFTVVVSNGQVSKAVDPAAVLALCPGDVVAQLNLYGMEPDPDNQCQFQTQLVGNNTVTLDATGITYTATSTSTDSTTMTIAIAASVGGTALVAIIAIAGYLYWKRQKDFAERNRVSSIQREFTTRA